MIHNPAAPVSGGRVYLHFMMNYGRGEFWEHRNRQRIGAAAADSPLGPFVKYEKPQFVNPSDPWSVEDPCVWAEDGRFYALVKDFHGRFTGVKDVWSGSTALFVSENGLDWSPDQEHPLAYQNELEFDDGPASFARLERPQIYLENGKPRFLLCACRFEQDGDAYNVKIPLKY